MVFRLTQLGADVQSGTAGISVRVLHIFRCGWEYKQHNLGSRLGGILNSIRHKNNTDGPGDILLK